MDTFGLVPGNKSMFDIAQDINAIDDMAKSLYDQITSHNKLILQKYNLIPEEVLELIIQKTQELSANTHKPVISIDFDEELLELFLKKYDNRNEQDSIAYYKKFFGVVLEGIEKTKFGDIEKIARIRGMYDQDFTQIYHPSNNYNDVRRAKFSKEEVLLLDGTKNIWANLNTFMKYFGANSEEDYHLLIHFSFPPAYDEGTLPGLQETENGIISSEHMEMVKKVGAMTGLVYYAMEALTGLSRTVVYPAWTTDVLKEWHPEKRFWDKSLVEGDMLHYEFNTTSTIKRI